MAKKTYNYVGDLFQMLYNKTIDEAKNLLGNDWTLKKTYDDDGGTRYFYFVSGDKKEDGEEEFLILLTDLKGKEHKNYYVFDVWTNTNEPYLVKTHELNEAETNMSIKDKKGAYEFKNSNLRFHGMKMDINGNPCFVLSTPNQRAFCPQKSYGFTFNWTSQGKNEITSKESGEKIVEMNTKGYPFKSKEDFEKYILDYYKDYPYFKKHVKVYGNNFACGKGNNFNLNKTDMKKQNNLQEIWAREMKSEPVLETANGIIYIQPSKDGKNLEYGSVTNAGMAVEGTYEYDFDRSLDYNIQQVSEQIFEENGYPEDDDENFSIKGGKSNFSAKEQKVVAFVWHKKSLNSSYYGNPRYLVDLRIKGGDMWYDCKTSSDGRLSYNNFQEGMLGEFTYHETANGNVILDDFKTIPMFKKGDVVKVKWENGWHKIKEVVLSQSRAENGNEADYVLDNGKSVREWLIEGKRGVGSKFIKKDDVISNFSILDDSNFDLYSAKNSSFGRNYKLSPKDTNVWQDKEIMIQNVNDIHDLMCWRFDDDNKDKCVRFDKEGGKGGTEYILSQEYFWEKVGDYKFGYNKFKDEFYIEQDGNRLFDVALKNGLYQFIPKSQSIYEEHFDKVRRDFAKWAKTARWERLVLPKRKDVVELIKKICIQQNFSIIDDTKGVLRAGGKLAGNIVKDTLYNGGILMF